MFKSKRSIYHKLKFKNEWLYTVYNDRLTITCRNFSNPQIRSIRGEGIIGIGDKTCQIHSDNAILTPEEELSTKTYENFIPKTDMSVLFMNFPNNTNTLLKDTVHMGIHNNIKLTDLHKITKSLEEVEAMADAELDKENNYVRIQHNNYAMYIIIGIITIALVIIFILLCMRKSNRRYSNGLFNPPYYVPPIPMSTLLPTNVIPQSVVPPSPR